MKLFLYIGFLAPLLPLLFFLLFKRKSQERAVWVILFYILYCAINEFISYYFQQIASPLIFYLFPLFTIIEISFISLYYYLLFESKKNTRKLILLSWFSFSVYAFFNIIFPTKNQFWDSIPMGIESLIILVLSSYYLFIKIKRTNNLSFYTNFYFWVAVTFLLYFSGTFFLNIMAESMRRNPEYQMLYFGINIGFNILKNVLLAVAMTMKLKIIKSPLPDLDDDLFFKNAQ